MDRENEKLSCASEENIEGAELSSEDELEEWLKQNRQAREECVKAHPDIKPVTTKIYSRESCPTECEELNNFLRHMKYGEKWDPWNYGPLGRADEKKTVQKGEV